MTAYAQEWADKLAREDGFEHRQNNAYGENLYSSWSSNPKAKVLDKSHDQLIIMAWKMEMVSFQITGNTPVDSWYSEVKKHDFTAEPRTTGTGHFTQVKQLSSQQLSVGDHPLRLRGF